MEERFDRMENMLGKLIGMVGTMSKEQKEMKADIIDIKSEQTSMKVDIADIKAEQASMKTENEVRHLEVLKRFSMMEADHNLIWGKAVNNERDIAKMKTHVFPHNNF